jgi:hypothetical protein
MAENPLTWQSKPEFKFTYSDADGHSMASYRIQVYNDAGGTSLAYDSGVIPLVVADGTVVTHQSTYLQSEALDRYAKITVVDSSGGTSTTSLRQYRIRYGYGTLSKNVGAGATALTPTIVPTTPAANTQRSIWYRLAADSAGSSATPWVSAIGSLPTPTIALPWVQVYVRLSSDLSGTNPTVDSINLSYLTAGDDPLPDKWEFSANSTLFNLDRSVRRYGAKSLKADALPSTTFIYPTREITDAEDLPVTPNTTYVFACEVRTNDLPLASGSLSLAVYDAGGAVLLAGGPSGETIEQDHETYGTYDADGLALYPEGWKRLRLVFTTPNDISVVRPGVLFTRDADDETFWVDGASLTEGTVAPPWAQGTVSQSGVVSSAGFVLDGAAGAVARLRGADGGLRSLVELGDTGLVFGGDTEIASPSTGVIEVNGVPVSTTGLVHGTSFPGSPAAGDFYYHDTYGDLFQYDGTRWLGSSFDFSFYAEIQNLSATDLDTSRTAPPGVSDKDVWVDEAVFSYYISGGTALSGSHKWQVDLLAVAIGGANATVATKTIQSGSLNTWRRDAAQAVNALLGAQRVMMYITATKTGTPGNLYCMVTLRCRVVGA